MHHGFYDPKSSIKKTRLQAQIDMIETTLDFAGITDIKSAVDVGCGIGGSSRYCSKLNKCSTPHDTSPPSRDAYGLHVHMTIRFISLPQEHHITIQAVRALVLCTGT